MHKSKNTNKNKNKNKNKNIKKMKIVRSNVKFITITMENWRDTHHQISIFISLYHHPNNESNHYNNNLNIKKIKTTMVTTKYKIKIKNNNYNNNSNNSYSSLIFQMFENWILPQLSENLTNKYFVALCIVIRLFSLLDFL